VQVRASGAAAAAGLDQLAAGAALDERGVAVAPAEGPELRRVDDVGEVVDEQIADLVLVQVHARRDRDPPVGRDRVDPEARAPAGAALAGMRDRSRQQRFAEVDLLAGVNIRVDGSAAMCSF
jgi:hypothetical protein